MVSQVVTKNEATTVRFIIRRAKIDTLIWCAAAVQEGPDIVAVAIAARIVSRLDQSSARSGNILQSGTRDLFLSNTVRMHRALRRVGVPAELHVFEAMPHGGFGEGTPEDEDLSDEIARFVRTVWTAA